MVRGASGRIVVEVDPQLKRELYAALAHRGLTLKAWLVGEARMLIEAGRQPSLFVAEENQTTYEPKLTDHSRDDDSEEET